MLGSSSLQRWLLLWHVLCTILDAIHCLPCDCGTKRLLTVCRRRATPSRCFHLSCAEGHLQLMGCSVDLRSNAYPRVCFRKQELPEENRHDVNSQPCVVSTDWPLSRIPGFRYGVPVPSAQRDNPETRISSRSMPHCGFSSLTVRHTPLK